jgi:hypothetical protein
MLTDNEKKAIKDVVDSFKNVTFNISANDWSTKLITDTVFGKIPQLNGIEAVNTLYELLETSICMYMSYVGKGFKGIYDTGYFEMIKVFIQGV